jgi:DNA-binding MarR family transcriptional regulator
MDKDVRTDTEMLLAAFREFRLGMQNWIEKTGSKTTLTHPQMILLAVLDDLGESTMTALTRKMGTTMGAVTNLVDRLVYAGFLDRQHDTQDRRVVKVRLKDEGRDLIRSANAEIVEYLARFFGQVPARDRKTFLAVYRKVGDLVRADEVADKTSAST